MWLRLELAQVARLRNHLPWILAVVFTSPRCSPRFLHTFNIDNNHLLPLPLPFRNKFTKIYHSDFPPFAQNNWITIRVFFFNESFNENSNHKENLKMFYSPPPPPPRAKSFVPLAPKISKNYLYRDVEIFHFTFPRLYTVLTSIPLMNKSIRTHHPRNPD